MKASATYTAGGTEDAEDRVRRDLDRIAAEVTLRIPEQALAALALTGGFARGEGAVVRDASGEVHAFNDYDFVVVTRRPVEAKPLLAAAPGIAEHLGIDFVDFGIFPEDVLPRVPATVFWYELREGHRVLTGDPDALLRIPPIDPARLPLVEATRLLLNRGLSLLWAWVHLEGALRQASALEPRPFRFTLNSIHKAVLAIGDAALIRAGSYHLSYRERAERVTRVTLPFPAKEKELFLAAHRRATDFKLGPDLSPIMPDQLSEFWSAVRGWHEAAFRWIEEERLGGAIGPWGRYPARLAVESFRSGLRHPRRFLRERGAAGIVKGWSRHFLDDEHGRRACLPFLLYGAGPAGPDTSLLESGLSGFARAGGAARDIWREASLKLIEGWHP